ncbi:MAG TPA: hypothetical protein VF490_21190 [Chryseosolibacter sp.]
MTHAALHDFYQKRKSFFSASLERVNRKIRIISNIRLAVALIFLTTLYFAFASHPLFYAFPVILAVFVFLVRIHSALFDRKVHLENLESIQVDERAALDGDFSRFNTGSEFINIRHPYSHDLDIFGEGSVFQCISRCNTHGAKQLMAEYLSSKPTSVEELRVRQEAIRELAMKPDFTQEVQAFAMQVQEEPNDQRQLQQWLDQRSFVFGRSYYRFVLTVFPLLTLALVVCAFFFDGIGKFALIAAACQWVITGLHLKRIKAFHQSISHRKTTLDRFAGILSLIEGEKYSSALLSDLGQQARNGDKKLKQLGSLVRALDARLNVLTNLVTNSLLLYDLQCVYRLERWREKSAKHALTWLRTICEAEVLCSFATFTFNHPRFAFPAITPERRLSAKGVGHPLLPDTVRVVNDIRLDRQRSVMIITGANMAGKSTFLRSLGVNVVLALAGAPVCASEFVCPLIDVRSGMRTADSLKDHQSYFYAELHRLKSIMDDLREGKPLLVLLDEILKGTNSTDKQAGSVALVKQLIEQPCLVVIATHDLALGDLAGLYPGRIVNSCFESNIDDGLLSFDYKLRAGLAQKMNATFLMKKMGILHPD